MGEEDWLSLSPVFVDNLGSVFGRDEGHSFGSLRLRCGFGNGLRGSPEWGRARGPCRSLPPVREGAGPLEVFGLANRILRSEGAVPYRPMVMSRPGGATRTASGLKLFTERLSAADDIDIDTLLLPGGPGVHAAAADRDLVAWLVSRAPEVRRVCSVCTGAF